MSKNTKTYLLAFLFWSINVKVFLFISNFDQISQIFKYSPDFSSFYSSLFKYYSVFVTTIPLMTLLLSILFAILLAVFWLYYFKIYFHRLPKSKIKNTGYFGILASVATFLGFGCVACGQTLLTSVLLVFVSSGSTFLAESIGNLSILLGIILISFGIYRNYKIFHDKNICKVEWKNLLVKLVRYFICNILNSYDKFKRKENFYDLRYVIYNFCWFVLV